MSWRGALLALALGHLACTSLPDIESNVCGNAVLEYENGEDCDTFVDYAGASCRPAGSVGECRFDCRVNADRTRSVCPPYLGCGADGLCRKPIEDAFDLPQSIADEPASWLSSLDFDGDGRFDIISTDPPNQSQQARFHLHYFDDDANRTEVRTFPRVTTRPVPRKLSEIEKSKSKSNATALLFSNYRVGMLPGRHDRAWVPSAFSSYTVDEKGMAVVSVYPDLVGWTTPFALVASLQKGPGIYVPALKTNNLAWLTSLPGTHRDLVGLPTPANVVDGAESPCDEVILAFRGERRVRVFDLCEPGRELTDPPLDWRSEPIEQVIELPYEVERAPLAADVDGDGHLDVIVGVREPARPATDEALAVAERVVAYVALGDGEQFAPAETVTLWVWEGRFDSIELVEATLAPPLAAGDISGDDVADFVFPNLVLASRPGAGGELTYFPAAENRGAPWTMAQVNDVNGNDLPDVVAASEGFPGVTLLNGTGGPYLVSANLVSHGPVRALTTGDFDGDQINDVAFCELGPPPENADALSITFGTRDGLPAPAQVVSEMYGVEQIGHYAEGGLDALFVTSMDRRPREPVGRFTLFDGSPDRLPFAPYTLVPFSVDMQLEDRLALALTSGAFTGRGASDVVALGIRENSWTLWLVPDIASGRTPPLLLDAPVPPGTFPLWPRPTQDQPAVFVGVSAAGIAADLDDDGRDEAIWLLPEDDVACALLVYRIVDESRAELDLHLRIDEPCTSPELSAADLGEGKFPELVVSTGQPGVMPRRLRVLWNDGKAPFSLENSSLVSVPEQADVRAFSVFPGRPRIAYVTADGLYQVSTRTDGRMFDDVERLWKPQDGRSVVVTDPNGDSLQDIVVSDARGLWLMKAALE